MLNIEYREMVSLCLLIQSLRNTSTERNSNVPNINYEFQIMILFFDIFIPVPGIAGHIMLHVIHCLYRCHYKTPGEMKYRLAEKLIFLKLIGMVSQ